MDGPVLEAELGLGPYVTTTPPLGGRLKVRIDDFRVDEVAPQPPPDPHGRFIAARLRLTNWETNAFLRAASDRLGVSRKKIRFSGTKDKRGVTERWFTFEASLADVRRLESLAGVTVVAAHPTARELELGEHVANRFVVTARGIPEPTATAADVIARAWREIEAAHGMPNYFGPQRFGARRATTHRVGERLVRGDFHGAVLVYLARPVGLPPEVMDDWRRALASRDWKAGLRLLPDGCESERALLHRLVETDDPLRALQVFPVTLQRLFVHALQSWVFNRILAKRIGDGLGHAHANVGDLAAPVEEGRLVDAWTPVASANLARVGKEIERGRAAITGLLPGTEAPFAEGEMGRIERDELQAQGLVPRDFLIPEHLEWSSKGTRRALHVLPSHFRFEVEPDDVLPGRTKATFTFELPPGAYATVLLREFLKSPRAADYG